MSEQTQVAVAEQPQQVALTVQDRAVIALGGIEREEALKSLAKKYADITEVKNKAGRQQVHAAGMELANERIATKKTGEAAREDAVALQKAVIAREKILIGIIEPEEKRLLALRDAWDEAEEAEKQAKLAAERDRVKGIRAKIDAIRATPARWLNKPSADIGVAADHLSETVISLDEYAEFAGEAQVERDHAVKQMREMQAKQAAHEAEQARIKAEREELARLRAEAEERERKAAAERAEQERKDRAERARIEAEQRAAQERAAEAMRQQQAEHEARMAAERAAVEAELHRQRKAEEARLAEQRAEIARQQAEIAAAKAEQERIEREAREAAEAEERRKREETEAAARAETERTEAERRAAEQEQIRREREQFAINGPGDVEIVKCVAYHYSVTVGDAMQWMKKFDYAATDEYFAAANVAAKSLEKAA